MTFASLEVLHPFSRIVVDAVYARSVLKPSRPIPEVGMRAVVQHLAADVDAVVRSVDDEGRRLRVETADGQTLEFTLRKSTGKFQAAGSGPRLKLMT
jgi:hypothetical protein